MDHKKPKSGKEKQSRNDSFDFSHYWFGSVRLVTKTTAFRCGIASRCKDAHLVCFLLMFIFFSLQSYLGIIIITLHMYFFSFGKKFKTVFLPQIFHTQFHLCPSFRVEWETSPLSCYCHSIIAILRFTGKSGIYKFRESLRFTDFHFFISRLNYQHSRVQCGIAESGITPCAVAHRQARSRQTPLKRRKAA